MGDCGTDALQVGFDGRLKLRFHDSEITSHARLLRVDPTMRPVAGMAEDRHAARTSQMGRFLFLEVKRYLCAIRLPANEILQRETEPLMTRPLHPPAEEPAVWYHRFLYINAIGGGP
jgi:hypothetical protein